LLLSIKKYDNQLNIIYVYIVLNETLISIT
jgi:hypothetical protein